MVRALVGVAVRAIRETSPALGTGEGLLPRVRTPVARQVRAQAEALAAARAAEGLLTRVDRLVAAQVSRFAEGHATDGARQTAPSGGGGDGGDAGGAGGSGVGLGAKFRGCVTVAIPVTVFHAVVSAASSPSSRGEPPGLSLCPRVSPHPRVSGRGPTPPACLSRPLRLSLHQ